MPNPDNTEDQQRMAEALLEAFPPDVPATEASRSTGLSDDTIRRWREEGVSLPLREPVKSSLYAWYTGQTREQVEARYGGGNSRSSYDLLDEIMEMIRDRPDRVDLNGVMIDYALAQRAVASRIRAEALRDEARNAERETELLQGRAATGPVESEVLKEHLGREGAGKSGTEGG